MNILRLIQILIFSRNYAEKLPEACTTSDVKFKCCYRDFKPNFKNINSCGKK